MNIVNKLTLRHLKENKGRTVITTLGICVSVAMITAVFVAVASMLNLFGEVELMGAGYKHAIFQVDESQYQQLKKDDRFSRIGLTTCPDYSSYQLENRKSDRLGTGDFYAGDSSNLEQMMTSEYEGILPKNKNEIAVEKEFIEKNELDWKIGDTVTIPMGERTLIDENGTESIVGGGYFGGEKFAVKDIGEFKITAILNTNPATAASFSIVRGLAADEIDFSDENLISAYVELKEVNYKSLDLLRDIVKEYDIQEYDLNTSYLETKFAIDENSTLATTILPMAAIVLVIIIIASVVLIYNSFGMSLSERIRYLGMLASVGATKKQKKASVYYEGLILGAIGIPVGILAGIAGIGITLKAVGKKIISTGMIMGVSDSNMNMDVVVPLWAVVGVIIFSIITIVISSFVPSRKASRVTPIDAIRQRNEIKVKSKKLKSPKIVRLIFGYEGELAHKNLKRNGRKSRVITASIALSVILFLSCNYFCFCFTTATNIEADVPYQIQTMVNYDDKDEFMKELDDMSGVDNYYCVNNSFVELSKDDSDTEIKKFVDESHLTTGYKNLFNNRMFMYLNYVDDEDFNKLCEENNIDYKEFYGDKNKALLLNNVNHKEGGAAVFNDSIIGLDMKLYELPFEIAAFVDYDADSYVCNLNASKASVSLFVPISVYYENAKELYGDLNSFSYMIGVETSQHKTVAENIQSVFDEKDFDSTYCADFVETMQVMNTLVFVLQVFIYGFIALISMITIANIINTISTGIAMRRKEFAMLKSVGTTPKGFRKMVALESAFYGIKALVVSLPLSALISFGMNKAMKLDLLPFEINWLLYLAVIAVVFVVVGLTMLYSVNKLKDDSIVETLKEEIN